MPTLDNNPFAILTFIAGPAVLTNASSVLALGTSNRFARNIDRGRALLKMLEGRDPNSDSEAAMLRTQLFRSERRAQLIIRALSAFYFAIGAFAAGSLTSLLGAILASTGHNEIVRPVLILALATGIAGLGSLIIGCSILITETRLALASLQAESAFYRASGSVHRRSGVTKNFCHRWGTDFTDERKEVRRSSLILCSSVPHLWLENPSDFLWVRSPEKRRLMQSVFTA